MADSKSFSTKSVFQQSPNSQVSSALVSIAPELRVKILRYVLKSCSPLINQEELSVDIKDPKDATKEGSPNTQEPSVQSAAPLTISLSSQVLATCQQMYAEGSQILYGENILSIHASDYTLSFLDTSIHFNNTALWETLKAQIELGHLLLDWKPNVEKSLENARSFNVERATSYMSPSPQKFSRYQLLILVYQRYNPYRIIFHACRILRPLFQGKQVTIKFAQLEETRAGPLFRQGKIQASICVQPSNAYLKTCRDLRCQSLKFDCASTLR